jgi:hypothetical protein
MRTKHHAASAVTAPMLTSMKVHEKPERPLSLASAIWSSTRAAKATIVII